ncbi:hypothetical protein HHK36_031547 [Tetracentron sinense]|uniref:ZF-HD dimerization-type domain-containing protein n=1 Tax=Tetracentron sinense TaxID=13715 RepID=A0A834Y9F6_TETSI|nr:hypothetical protein HHK36_031547 [Tetracentron sinense]
MEEESGNEFYRECLRNHAANLGSYATDGCGEFTVDDTTPGGLKCAACGCHRNFHRKIISVDDGGGRVVGKSGGEREAGVVELIEYGREQDNRVVVSEESERNGKKRNRTKFTGEQKEKMLAYAEKLGWKLQRKDEENEIERFCRGVGVSRQVFKVWMHNHKNTSSSSASASASTANASSLTQ